MMKKLLVVQALREEEATLPSIEGYEVERIYTGCGKVAAAVGMLRAIYTRRPDLVLNVGTVGARQHSVGSVVACSSFVDRDLNPLCIYGIVSRVESCTDEPLAKAIMQRIPSGVCSTGDSFVTGQLSGADVCDMEAFAQALVCQQENIPFVAVKYVTDIVGQNSVAAWEAKLADARKGLSQFFMDLL